MNFVDDSAILSKLGILESKEESPKRSVFLPNKGNQLGISEKEQFVEVSIDGDFNIHSDSEEEDSVLDRNSLLSSSRNVRGLRRVSESYKCRYFVLLATYVAVGFVIYPYSGALYSFTRLHVPALLNGTGLVLGSLAGKLCIPRFNLLFLLLVSLILLTSVRWVSLTANNIDQTLSSFGEGFAAGAIFYGGLATWLLYWRGHTRKIILFYLVMAIPLPILPMEGNTEIMDNKTLGDIRYKRSVGSGENAFSNFTAVNNDLNYNESITLRPKKPKIVQGIISVDSKTKENEQMRKAAEETLKATAIANASIVPVTPPTSSKTITSSSRVSNTVVSTTVTFKLQSSTLNPSFNAENSTTPMSQIVYTLNSFDQSMEKITIGILTSVIFMYLLGFTFCCFSFSFTADAKIVKIYDPSVPGLTRHCRFRLAFVQMLSGFLEALFMGLLSALDLQIGGSSRVQYSLGALFISRFLALLCGSCAFSVVTCSLLLLCLITGSFILSFISAHSLLGVLLIGISIGLFGLATFLNIESRLIPRASVQLDYFVVPSLFGRFLNSLLCFSICPLELYQMLDLMLLFSILLTICFIFLAKSVQKAARLKEIMEYSSSPLPEASAEYVSLVDRGLPSDVEDDDVASV